MAQRGSEVRAQESPGGSHYLRAAGEVLALAGIYLAAAWLGLSMARPGTNATAVWLPTGIAIAAVLRLGFRVWPGIFLGSLAVNAWLLIRLGLSPQAVLLASAAAATGNTVEAVLAGYFVQRFAGSRNPFRRSRDVVYFIFYAVLLSTAVSALMGVSALSVATGRWGLFGVSALTWWLGDATGALLITPLVMTFDQRDQRAGTRGQRLEFLLFAGLTSVLWYVSFFKTPALVVVFIPWIALIGVRLGILYSSAVVLLLAGLATWGTIQGVGPFTGGPLEESLLLQQAFIGSIAVATLVLGSTVREMGDERRQLQDAYRFERKIFERSSLGMALCTLDGRLVEVNPAYAALLGRTVQETLSLTYWDVTPKEYAEQEEAQLASLRHTGRYGPYEKEYLRKDGSRVPVRLSGLLIERQGNTFIWSTVEDIADRKRAEARLTLLNRVLTTLSEVNELIVREDDIETLWRRTCDILVERGEMAIAWIGVKEPQGGRLRPAAWAGIKEEEVRAITVRWDDAPEGGGSMGTAIRTKRHSVHQDLRSDPRFAPWSGFMEAHEFRAVAAFPLLLRGEPVGALAVYVQTAGAFHPDVISLLDDLAADLGFAHEAIDNRLERAKTEESLRKSEAKYRELVENANSIILRWLPDGTITFLNEFGLAFFGYHEEELLGRHLVGTIVPELEREGRDLRPLMREIAKNPAAFEQNVNENVRRDGSKIWIAWTNKAVLDQNGNVAEIFSVGTDITDKRRAEREIVALNAELERRVEERTKELQEALSALHAETRELQMAQANIVGLNSSLERQAQELRVANRHLQNALTKAESAEQVKSAFLAAMSHELRTPLNSVIGFTGALLGGLVGDLNADQREALEIVRRNGQHLLALINDVLDISKLEAGQMRLSSQPFDLAQTVRESVQSMEQQAGAKHLSLLVEGADRTLPFQGDQRRVAQMVINLLSNAIKFTEEGSVTVRLAPDLSGNHIEVKVEDTGIGILAADYERIFREFEQLDSGIARGAEGTGLGLSLSRKMARLMGGDILVDSVRGRGSIFTLRLPNGTGSAR